MVIISGIRNMMLLKVASFHCILNGVMIILHDNVKTIHSYEVTKQNIPNLFCYVYLDLLTDKNICLTKLTLLLVER